MCKKGCDDLCIACCVYGGDHPRYKCPLFPPCPKCVDDCEGCVVYNHFPEKTMYGGTKIYKCSHVTRGITRRQVLEEEVRRCRKRYETARDEFDSAKKKLKEDKE